MPVTNENSLVISQTDYQRLMALIERLSTAATESLENELGRAEIVNEQHFPVDAVSMNSMVTFVDLDSGEETTVSLVFPWDVDVDQLKISILSPVGSALIGLRIGGHIDWPLPQGKIRRLKVIAVSQQHK
jgi:regulator of nucleoside diphosphate kinase